MKLIPLFILLACPVGLTASAQQVPARDTRPVHSYLALPPIGTRVPAFHYTLATGGALSPAALEGAPTVLVLWSTWCSASRRVLSAVESLHSEYGPRGVNVVILAADSLATLQRFRERVPVRSMLASASDLTTRFDFSATAPERDSVRMAFALPSVLVLDKAVVVVSRNGLSPSSFDGVRAKVEALLAADR